MRRACLPKVVGLAVCSLTLTASADTRPNVVQNPYHNPHPEPVKVDVSAGRTPIPEPAVRFEDLDKHQRFVETQNPDARQTHILPPGLTQVGGMVVPEEMLDGADMVGDVEAVLRAPGEDEPVAGKEEWCAFPDAVPAGVYEGDSRPAGEVPRYHTVYLNFTGGVLYSGGENSAENISNIAISGHEFPVYAGGETRAIAASQAVAGDFQDLAVRVVYLERPRKIIPYTMVMVGGSHDDTTAGPSGGVAPLDCEDFGQRNVCYAFQNLSPAISQANVISQEIGHTMGLGHTTDPTSVMALGYSPTQGGDLGFGDQCHPNVQVANQGAACIGVNKCHCGDGDTQNDMATLGVTFAPPGPDMVAPTIAITAPEDGAEYQMTDTVVVTMDVGDNFGGYGWKLVMTDEAGEVLVDQVDYDRSTEFLLAGFEEPGTYTLIAEIEDQADNVTTDSITIVVLPGEGGTTGVDGTGDGTGDETGTDSDSDSVGEVESGDDGCQCRSGTGPRGAAALALLLGLAGWRTRRRGARG